MPSTGRSCPSCADVVDYLTQYEQHYHLPIERPVRVNGITREKNHFEVHSADRVWQSHAIVSATGTWSHPYVPAYPGMDLYVGQHIHSAHYHDAAPFKGKRVLVIGGGNSGAQILAEVSLVADATWVTLNPPSFLPDEVDGRVLFERATARWKAQQEGRVLDAPPGGLGDIIMVPSVLEARERGVLHAKRPFVAFTANGVIWPDGVETPVDAVIWCTGFRPALQHLAPLHVIEPHGRVATDGTRSTREPGLWLVGYGDWTGMASATLIGVTRTARSTVEELRAYCNACNLK